MNTLSEIPILSQFNIKEDNRNQTYQNSSEPQFSSDSSIINRATFHLSGLQQQQTPPSRRMTETHYKVRTIESVGVLAIVILDEV